MVSVAVTWATNFGTGRLGNTGLPVDYRILQAQAIILVAAIGAQVLAALFAEQVENEGRLAPSNAMLERERDNKLLQGSGDYGCDRDGSFVKTIPGSKLPGLRRAQSSATIIPSLRDKIPFLRPVHIFGSTSARADKSRTRATSTRRLPTNLSIRRGRITKRSLPSIARS